MAAIVNYYNGLIRLDTMKRELVEWNIDLKNAVKKDKDGKYSKSPTYERVPF